MAYLATIAPFGFDDFNLPTWLPVLRELGCVACQFYRNEKNPPKPAEAVLITRDAGLPIDSIHGVFGAKYDPSSPDEAIRRAAVKAYVAEGELALALGCSKVVVHPSPPAPGIVPGTSLASGKTSLAFVSSLEGRMDAMRKTLEELSVMGEKRGVTYLLENVPGNFPLGNDPLVLADLLREAKAPNLKMCFDTGHAHMTCEVVQTMRACADVIDYLHVSDNNGQRDSHLVPGHGTIPWDQLGPVIASLPVGTASMLELFSPQGLLQRECDGGLGLQLCSMLGLT